MIELDNRFSRRNFLKNGTIIGFGSVLFSDPVVQALGTKHKIDPKEASRICFTVDILRNLDLLHLRYLFYNAKLSGGYILPVVREYPVFVYIQLPALCVGEEVINKNLINSRADFKRTMSFLGERSRLAFRMVVKKLAFTAEELLDWSANFQMVTLDDFVVKLKKYRIGYPDMLSHTQQDFLTPSNTPRGDLLTWHQNFQNSSDVSWPLTKFEIPYKIFLSPIAPGAQISAEEQVEGMPRGEKFVRQYGEYEFIGSNLTKTEFYNDKVEIVRIWENRLMFRDNGNAYADPNFKAVTWDCQNAEDHDTQSDLIPAPINREEINGLTMRPEFDRDIFSYGFKIGAYGATAHLKYRNDDPDMYSLVCFELITKYGRDNFASVSFRAVDTFTGMKLLVSVLTVRDYKFGVSFLPKLYYVSYAEKQKIYSSEEVLSRTPFVKIIADTDGQFFLPREVENTSLCYHVQKDLGLVTDPLTKELLLDFKYRGYDKAGVEHKFTGKIIFVPAENYEIISGTYNYNLRDQTEVPYGGGKIVPIRHIGLLNPSYQERYQTNPQANRCAVPGHVPEYIFRMNKTFSDHGIPALKQNLDAAQKHVAAHKDWYTMSIQAEMTYARITALKAAVKDPRSGKVSESVIPKDSSNASFNTKGILFFADANDNPAYPANDRALGTNPLLAKMLETDVIISQIDQLEGKSTYRTVSYASSYFDTKKELDEPDARNKVKLLFQLANPLENFFGDNYRSAGAMVKPEKKIGHLSILQQSLAYDESHNAANATIVRTDAEVVTHVSSASIFDSLKAEIFGIPLTEIISETLGVEELPCFNYIQQVEESIEKIREIARQYKAITEKWLNDYKLLKDTLENYKDELSNLEKLVKLEGNPVKAWLESLVSQSNIQLLYTSQKNSLEQLRQQYDAYIKEVLVPVNNAIQARIPNLNIRNELDVVVSAFSNAPDAAALASLEALMIKIKAEKNFAPALFRETVKLYAIDTVRSSPAMMSVLESVVNARDQLNASYAEYLNAFTNGYQESVAFCEAYINERLNTLLNQINQTANNIPLVIKAALNKAESGFMTKVYPWLVTFGKIRYTYKHYAGIYTDLKAGHYEKLAEELQLPKSFPTVKILEKELTGKLRLVIQNIKMPEGISLKKRQQLEKLKKLFTDALSNDKNWLGDYDNLYEKYFKEEVENEWKSYLLVFTGFDVQYQDYLRKYEELTRFIAKTEKEVKNFVQDLITFVKQELEKKKREIVNAVKGSAEYNAISNLIDQYNSLIAKISELSKQKLEYNFRTDKFRRASLGGAIDFIPGSTVLTVNVAYEIEFDISLDGPPSIKKQSFYTDSKITDFKIGLMQLLFVDFESVHFITGSDVKDDFNVNIRDVQFAGCLSFVQAMQEFLSTISDNLVFDIDCKGARIGYGFSIPDFSAGYFNFFNFNLSALLTLPFNPKESLQLMFGFGSPLNKFGITVSGIFGGQGYVNLIAEPRRGIVGMEIVLEFGAIFNLNLTVASGTAYLVGGIYIRRYDGVYKTKAYILCVGRFNVLGLFSASITFYLGLEGDGSVLVGQCTVKVSKRFTRFFEISVSCGMSKTIKGADDGNHKQKRTRLLSEEDNARMNAMGIFIQDSNLHQELFYDDEIAYLTLWTKDEDATIDINTINSRQNAYSLNKRQIKNKKFEGTFHYVKIRPSKYAAGESCDIIIKKADGTLLFSKKITALKSPAKPCDAQDIQQVYVNDYEYYASYYR